MVWFSAEFRGFSLYTPYLVGEFHWYLRGKVSDLMPLLIVGFDAVLEGQFRRGQPMQFSGLLSKEMRVLRKHAFSGAISEGNSL
jgi:hypothetical protein